MIAPRTLSADVLVRNHSGETVLDWDGIDARQVKHYRADPQRLHRATTRLAELGFTVVSVGPHGLSVEATPTSFQDAFDLTPVYGPGAGADDTVRWRPPGGLSDPVVRLAASSELGGAIGAIMFTEPAEQLRTIEIEEVDFVTNPPQPTDLLLGEAGQSLLQAMPERVKQQRSFPSTFEETLRLTKVSIDEWNDDLQLKQVRDHLEVLAKALHRPPGVEAVILESCAEPRFDLILKELQLLTGAPLHQPKASFHEDSIYGIKSAWNDGKIGQFWRETTRWFIEVVAWECDKIIQAGRGIRERIGLRHSGQTDPSLDDEDRAFVRGEGLVIQEMRTKFVARCVGVCEELARIPQVIADAAKLSISLHLAAPQDWPQPIAGSSVPQAILDIDSELKTAQSLATAIADWDRQVEPLLNSLAAWKQAELPEFLRRRRVARHIVVAHFTMVNLAFRAASASLVEQSSRAQSSPFWPLNLSTGRKTVTSLSKGDPFGQKGSSTTIQSERALAGDLLHRSDVLHVLAAGNNVAALSKDDGPSRNSSFAEVENVLLVGGCYPTKAGLWFASSATHGFSFTTADPVKGPQTRFVPDLCATTNSGSDGGAVVFPVISIGTADDVTQVTFTLRYGGGSSLSAPLVAALCSLVWSCYPELEAKEVKACILDSALPLDGGQFHFPTGKSGLQLNANSEQIASHPGARRPALEPALRKAQEVYAKKLGGKSVPLRRPVLPPPGNIAAPAQTPAPAAVPAPAPPPKPRRPLPPVPVKSGVKT